MSILTDFYNLDLNLTGITEAGWRTPEVDREKIVDFFKEHASSVLKYRTAAEIEAPQKPLGAEMIGTLGYFEYRRKQSWFDSDAFNFYVNDYQWVQRIIDSYLEEKTHEGTVAFITSLLQDVRMFTTIKSKKEGREYGSANAPKPINYQDYSWNTRIGTITTTSSDSSKVQLNLGGLYFKLHNEFLSLLNGESEVRKCEANDCQLLFNPKFKKQIYHSDRCRKRMWARKHKF